MKNWTQKNFYSALLSCGFLLTASRVLADNPNDYLHARTYVGIVGTSVSVDSSTLFNGLNYARVDAPSYEIDLIPKLGQNFGFGVLAGHREEAYAMEISYWQSNHTASFGPGSVSGPSGTVELPLTQDTAVYRSVNLDFKRYFLTELQTQPFINLGVSFPWITVSNAAADGNGDIGSLTLAGLGLDLGVGMEFYLTPNFSLVGVAAQRWASFDQFKGFAQQFSPLLPSGGVASDSGSGLIFTIGTTVGFE